MWNFLLAKINVSRVHCRSWNTCHFLESSSLLVSCWTTYLHPWPCSMMRLKNTKMRIISKLFIIWNLIKPNQPIWQAAETTAAELQRSESTKKANRFRKSISWKVVLSQAQPLQLCELAELVNHTMLVLQWYGYYTWKQVWKHYFSSNSLHSKAKSLEKSCDKQNVVLCKGFYVKWFMSTVVITSMHRWAKDIF